jgi:hypothetical protein
MTYSVQALKVGQCEVPGPEVYWMADWDLWHRLFFIVLLVRGHGVTALVNSGPPLNLDPINESWVAAFGERGRFLQSDEDQLLNRLAASGVAAEEITHLIVTPLQLYSTGGIPLFPNAQICLSRKGWVHYHTTHEHPHDRRWSSISPEVLTYLTIEAWPRVRLLEDEAELATGLRTWWAGAHHRASLAVEIDTADGTVVASDAFFTYQNVEQDRVLGISENIYEALACYARARRVAQRLVPLYDPLVFERFPGGVVSGGS